MLTIEKWYVKENEVILPGAKILSIEGPPGFFDIPTPPSVIGPVRVKQIFVGAGERVCLGDLLITLESTAS